eukprot:3116203-Lingulodinium_polyedra.AAC.1
MWWGPAACFSPSVAPGTRGYRFVRGHAPLAPRRAVGMWRVPRLGRVAPSGLSRGADLISSVGVGAGVDVGVGVGVGVGDGVAFGVGVGVGIGVGVGVGVVGRSC